jgi:hypothetical protein
VEISSSSEIEVGDDPAAITDDCRNHLLAGDDSAAVIAADCHHYHHHAGDVATDLTTDCHLHHAGDVVLPALTLAAVAVGGVYCGTDSNPHSPVTDVTLRPGDPLQVAEAGDEDSDAELSSTSESGGDSDGLRTGDTSSGEEKMVSGK